MHIPALLAILLGVQVPGWTESKPAAELARLSRDLHKAIEVLDSGRKSGTTEAEKKAVTDRHVGQVGVLSRHRLGGRRDVSRCPRGPGSLGLDHRPPRFH